MAYTYDKKLTTSRGGVVCIDTTARYGYWERLDGSEGGGLWFEPVRDHQGDSMGPLELVDYDGTHELRADIVACLREAGYFLDDGY